MAIGLLQSNTGNINMHVGKHWTERFLKRHPQLETTPSQALDNNWAKATHSETIHQWFNLLTKVIDEYGIEDKNIYNFDKKGVLMGIAATAKIISRVKDKWRFKTQPGNCEFVTIIKGVNCRGWAIPPTLVFKGKYHQSSWWQQDLVDGTKIAISSRGWSDSELAVK